MEYCYQKSSGLLSQYVKSYWMIENATPEGSEYIQRIIPAGLSDISFYLGDVPESLDSKKDMSDNTIISGQLKNYFDIKISGKLSLFSISFYPHGLSYFLDIPVKELENTTVPLKLIASDFTRRLEDILSAADSFSERIKIAEEFIYKRIIEKGNDYKQVRIDHAIRMINSSKGAVDIDTLASEACLGRKQFVRTFSEHIGASPKQFLKVVRFQNALDIKARNKDILLTSLAMDSGYYDQSHMINDFVSLTGKNPKAFFSECNPISDYFE